jgi:hypothetical protein
MNTKTANLIALELGILIAILAWLAFSNVSSVKRHMVTGDQERAAGSFATITPVLNAGNQRPRAADYLADRAGEQQADEQQGATAQQYDQEVAAEPYANAGLNDGVITGSSPYYAGVAQEPLAYPPDCLVSPLDQIVSYAQPTQVIIFSNTRSFARRPRSTPRFGGGRMMVAQRPPGGRDFRATGGGFAPRRSVSARPSRPTRGSQGSLHR